MEAIKACPHCGGEAWLHSNYGYRKYFVFCKCGICGASGKSYSLREAPSDSDWETPECAAAVMAWNMRTPERAEHSDDEETGSS